MNGMADNEDGDNLFDDDFADIPVDELQRLEQDAISFTQQESHYHSFQKPQNTRNSVPVTVIQGNGSLNNRVQHNPRPNQSTGRNANFLQSHSSGGTIFDDDGPPLIAEDEPQIVRPRLPDETTQREQWRLDRFAQSSLRAPPQQDAYQRTPHGSGRNTLPNQAQSNKSATFLGQRPQSDFSNGIGHKTVEEDALRATIAELMRERDTLTTNLHQAERELVARSGEISIIRSKQIRDEKEHQRQLDTLQKLKHEEHQKHAAALQALNAENAKTASAIQFLKEELREESRKAQAYQRQLKDRPLSEKPVNGNTTPKRHHTLRDGFDEDEMMVISPVKSGRRSKQGTPTANRKRKQPTDNNSHIQPLALRLSGAALPDAEPRFPVGVGSEVLGERADQLAAIVKRSQLSEQHLRLVQSLTTFRPKGSREILIELLFKCHFPSEPNESLGASVAADIAKLNGQRLPGDLIEIFIKLWARAINEKYTQCLGLFIEAITFILDQDPLVIDVALLNSFLPLLQSTVEINATARFALVKKEWLNDPAKIKPVINEHIDNAACLELCHTIACLVSDDRELITRFWGSFSTDFVLMMLNSCQPIPDIMQMLLILETSILPTTFAMICPASQQARYEVYVLDRICWLLWDFFRPDPEALKPGYPLAKICQLRQQSLDLITALTLGTAANPYDPTTATNHGTTFLANHPNAIHRINRCIYDELALAYHMSNTQHHHIQLVNTAVRILHFVLFSPAGRQLDWQSKLNAATGGSQKFRVAMARLTYAEGNVDPGIDCGITEDTVRMATEMLEESVIPDEVDDLVRVFEGTGVSAGNSQSGGEGRSSASATAAAAAAARGNEGVARSST